jgi:hypothetical protein
VTDLDVEMLLARREQLEQTVLASAVASRAILSPSERPIREIGQLLFSALLGSAQVAGRYRASSALAAERGEGLRVVLRVDTPALAGLPWEAMYDAEAGAYVCRRDQLVRHVPAASAPTPLTVRPPLRILGVVSSPRGLPALDSEKEQEQLAEALAGPRQGGLVDVHWAPEATWAALQDVLLAGEWHVLHFVGHGGFDVTRDEGVLTLVADNGRADFVEADKIVDLLRQARPMPRLVVLNSCDGAETGISDLFSGTAAALVRGGVSAVAAMQYQISDTAAVAFARGFYTAIAHGRGVDDATASGRVAILGSRPRTLEWITPVMYLRGDESRLFLLPSQYSSGTQTSIQEKVDPPSGDHPTSENELSVDRPHRLTDISSPRVPDPGQHRVAERRKAEAEFRTASVRGQLASFERLLAERNRNLASESSRIANAYHARGPDALVATLLAALATSVYPAGLHGSCAAAYRPDDHELLIEYELPPRDVVPSVDEYKFMPTTNLVEPIPFSKRKINNIYMSLLARIILRTMAEAFDAAPIKLIDAIVLNGYVSGTESTTGKQIRPVLVSLMATRSVFSELVLDKLDPASCLRHLNALVSPNPYDMEAVRPIVKFDLPKANFVEELDVVAGLGRRPNLLNLAPLEFEHLIRQLFESLGMKSWITQESRDEGIDVVAYDESPIVGGLYIILVKRYRTIVGVESVRALAGLVEEKHAVKGILVTTSRVSSASAHLAARSGRIEIIDGSRLKDMLKQHLGLDVIIDTFES